MDKTYLHRRSFSLKNTSHSVYEVFENKGISKIKDILYEKWDFIDQSKINLKYKVNISFLELLNITSWIPKSRNKILNICQHLSQNIPIENCTQVQNVLKILNKTTCKDIYWHTLNLENYNYKPTRIKIVDQIVLRFQYQS